jgi:phage shock protein A
MEKQMHRQVEALIALFERIGEARANYERTEVALDGTVLQEASDPAVAFRKASGLEAELRAQMVAGADVADISEKGEGVVQAFEAALAMKTSVKDAIENAGPTAERLEEKISRIEAKFAEIRTAIEGLQAEHSFESLTVARAEVVEAVREVAEGREWVENVKRLLAERRHVEAMEAAARAERECGEGAKEVRDVVVVRDLLVEVRLDAMKTLRGLDATRLALAADIAKLGGDPAILLSGGDALRGDISDSTGPIDWNAQNRTIESIVKSWRDGLRTAKDSYRKGLEEIRGKVLALQKLADECMREINRASEAISDAEFSETLDLFTDSVLVSALSSMDTSDANDAIGRVRSRVKRFQGELEAFNGSLKSNPLADRIGDLDDTLDLVFDLVFDGFDFLSVLNLFALSNASGKLSELFRNIEKVSRDLSKREASLAKAITAVG